MRLRDPFILEWMFQWHLKMERFMAAHMFFLYVVMRALIFVMGMPSGISMVYYMFGVIEVVVVGLDGGGSCC
jgi:hypothetical protein